MQRNPWIIAFLYTLVGVSHIQGEVLKSLLWDPRNKLFDERCAPKENENHARIFVNSMAKLTFLCPATAVVPLRSAKPVSSYALFENLYIVTKKEFDDCEVNPDNPESRLLLQCDEALNLNYLKYYTVVFRKWRASRNGLKFTPNNTYYFIATSDGSKASLLNLKGGRCRTRNMRLAVTICGWDCSTCENMCCKDEFPMTTSSPIAQGVTTVTQQTVATARTSAAVAPVNISNGIRTNSTQRPSVVVNGVSNKVPRQGQSVEARKGNAYDESPNPILLFAAGFVLAMFCAAVLFGIVQYRRRAHRRRNVVYGGECKTQVGVSPSIRKSGKRVFQRLYSTSSSTSRGSGTDSL